MVNTCCIINCHNRSRDRRGKRTAKGVRFFCFPAWKQNNGTQVAELTKRRRMAWVSAVRLKNVTFNNISRHMVVCSRHFHAGKPAYEMLEDHPDWAPSLHLGHTEVKSERFNRRTKRQQALTVNNTAPAIPSDLAVQISEMDEVAPPDLVAQRSQVDGAAQRSQVDGAAQRSQVDGAAQRLQVDDTAQRLQVDEGAPMDNTGEQQECSFCSRRRAEINLLLEENRMLKEQLSLKKVDKHFVKDHDVKEGVRVTPSSPVAGNRPASPGLQHLLTSPHQNESHTSAPTSGTNHAHLLKNTDFTKRSSKHQLGVSQGPPGPDGACRNGYTQTRVLQVKVEDIYGPQTGQLWPPVKEEEEQLEISQLTTEHFAIKKEEEDSLTNLPQSAVSESPGFDPSPTPSSSSESTDESDEWPDEGPAKKASRSNSLFGKDKLSKQDVSKEDSLQGAKSNPKAKLHLCVTCGKRFVSLSGLRRHSVMHNGKKPHPCQKCNKRFWTPAEVKRHIMTHTGEKPFPCPDCDKCFTLQASLKVHQRIHTGEKPHVCSVCGKGFTQPGNLRIHERRHTGERPFSCSHCDRTFIEQGHLKKHIRRHTGERPYICSECPMKFISSTELKVHWRIHSKEKNYSCAFCDKKFSQPHNARIHQKIHMD